MIRYPNGNAFVKEESKPAALKKVKSRRSFSSANRGMKLEDDINASNEWYRSQKLCLITKRPTPINVVKVDYSHGAMITHAYFERQSTTDYNGVYQGKYIDFEAKNTKNKTAFPLNNISPHQIDHLKQVLYHGGIAFFIVEFETWNQVFLLDASFVIDFYEHRKRQSIPYQTFLDEGILIEQSYNPRLNYLEAIKKKYF